MTVFTSKITLSLMAVATTALSAVPALANGLHAAPSPTVNVDLNRTTVLRLPYPASAIVVGNPDIADIAVHSTDTVLVLGRSFGNTNIVAMDSAGRVILDQEIMVHAGQVQGRVRLYEGAGMRKTFNCNPDCLPSPELGDDVAFRAQNASDADALTGQVASTASAPGSIGQIAPNPSFAAPAPYQTYGDSAAGVGGFGGQTN